MKIEYFPYQYSDVLTNNLQLLRRTLKSQEEKPTFLANSGKIVQRMFTHALSRVNPNRLVIKYRRLAILVPIFIIATLIDVTTLFAHTRVELDPYVIIVGWENEPVIVGERNALTFEITRNEVPVEGLESSLDASVLYAGRSFIGDFIPTETAGLYSVEILPTVRGLYTVQLSGMIEDTEVDELIEPEEVLPANVLQFPESPPEARDLQAEIDVLSNQINIARFLAIVGVSLALVGILIAAFALIRSRKPH